MIGLPEAIAVESAANQDTHVRLLSRSARAARVLDRARSQQGWPLLHFSSAQNGHLRRIRVRPAGPFPDHHPTKGLFRQDQSQSQNLADFRQQLDRMSSVIASSSPDED